MGDNASFNMFVELSNQRRIPLEIGQLYLLGKQINGLENKSKHFIELAAADEVEQKHCVIDVSQNEDVFVYDLFSLKGTLLNNKPLKGLERLRLQNGDILKLGNQEIKFIHDQQEVSHDSSGFLEVNKNTSDIIASSPDSTSHLESRLKRDNYNNFLVPSIPPKKSITPNKSLVIPETEALHISKNSLNASSTSVSSNNRRSDSFTIPETQYCRARDSLNASDLSIAESIPDDNAKKINFNFDNLDDLEEDDLCIPETQEVLPPGAGITSSQRPRLLSNAKERSILVEETSNAKDDVEGSQFRICTQDYNEGFGEEAEAMQSQIIPLIKHNTVILNASTNKLGNENASSKSCNESANNPSKPEEDEDKELSDLNWSYSKIDREKTELRADCSTPDIFDFDDKEQPEAKNEKDKLVTSNNVMEEDEEDLLPTQVFPSSSRKTLTKKSLKELDKPCVDKEQEEILTLSDKENRCPVTLEPITDLPPTQLFAINEFSSARSTTSTSSRNSLNAGLKTNTPAAVEVQNNFKPQLNVDPDEEDDLLTQAFLQPSNPPSSSTSVTHKNIPIKCFNSTVLEDKFMGNNPHTFFAEMEKTPLKTSSPAANAFKVPDKDFSVLKKTSSATSTTSENDLDLLMCTPQLIKDHMFMDKPEDLKKNILAAKNRNLFGEDTDDDKEDDDDQEDLVKLINVPKDTLDFDKLLPHLNKKSPNSEEKNKKEEIEAKEANKVYKFNISFGKEQEQTSISKSSTLSRDERHVARDKERELAERKERSKTKGVSARGRKPKSTEQTKTHTKQEDEQDKNASNKQDKPRQHRKRQAKEDKSTETENESKLEEKPKGKEDKLEKNKHDRKKQRKESKSTETAKESKVEEKSKELPARRMTRAKSRLDEAPSSSTEIASMKSTKTKQQEETEEGDDLDSIATQPFVVRISRRRSTSKQSESQSSIASNNSRKSSQHNKSKNDSSLSHNISSNGSITMKATGERKRKAESTPPVVPAKVERKRLRSTHSQDSAASTTSSSSKVLISMTMVDHELFKSLIEHSNGIWHVAKDPADSEILVMDKAFRTFKFLLAMARGIPIVTSEYLKKLNQTQSLKRVKINDYLFMDAEFEKKHKCSLIKSQQMARKHKLFKGYEFVMTANILPNPREIHAIIEASGGFVHTKTPPAPKDNQKIYLITSKEDKKDWHKFRRLNKNIVIVSTEAIMSAIMRQSCDSMSSYTLA